MTGKYDALIAEMDTAIANRLEGSHDPAICAMLSRAATALREAQAHVPPEGWRGTEYTREDGAMVIAAGSQEDLIAGNLMWTRFTTENKFVGDFPTAAAAMAALEEMK